MNCKVCGKELIETQSEPYEDEGNWYISLKLTCPDYKKSDDMTAWVFRYNDHDDVVQMIRQIEK